jgi:hypothetical protein
MKKEGEGEEVKLTMAAKQVTGRVTGLRARRVAVDQRGETHLMSALEELRHKFSNMSRRKSRLHDPPLTAVVVSLSEEHALAEY